MWRCRDVEMLLIYVSTAVIPSFCVKPFRILCFDTRINDEQTAYTRLRVSRSWTVQLGVGRRFTPDQGENHLCWVTSAKHSDLFSLEVFDGFHSEVDRTDQKR